MTVVRNRTLTFRVTDDEFTKLQMASATAGARCLSDYIRESALEAAQHGDRRELSVQLLSVQIQNLDQRLGSVEERLERPRPHVNESKS